MTQLCRILHSAEDAKADGTLVPEVNTLYLLGDVDKKTSELCLTGLTWDPANVLNTGEDLPLFLEDVPTVVGPSTLAVGQQGEYRITNLKYPLRNISVIAGEGEIQGGSTSQLDYSQSGIFYYTPSTISSDGFTVAGIFFPVTITDKKVVKPEIVYPLWNSSEINPKNLTISTTPYETIPASYDGHLSTDWEISSDPNFENIVYSSYGDTANLTSLELIESWQD